MKALWRIAASSLVMALVLGLLAGCVVPPTAPAQPAPPAPASPTQPAAAAAAQGYKACWIYSRAISDQGWVQSADAARLAVEKATSGLKTVAVESVPGGADAERVIGQLADSGCQMIITTSAKYVDAVEAVAAKYPNVKFECMECNKSTQNIAVYRILWADGFYLGGMLAGGMTKSNLIGWVLPSPIPDLLRSTNQLVRGARAVNPKVVVQLIWTNNFNDPVVEKDATQTLIAAGADVILHQQAGATVLQTAEAKSVFSVGLTEQQDQYAPQYILTSVNCDLKRAYTGWVKAAMDGTWKATDSWYTSADGMVGITGYGPKVPADLKKSVDQAKADMLSGKLDIWKGPMIDQQGKVRVADGKRMTMDEIATVDWLIEGIKGSLPTK